MVVVKGMKQSIFHQKNVLLWSPPPHPYPRNKKTAMDHSFWRKETGKKMMEVDQTSDKSVCDCLLK